MIFKKILLPVVVGSSFYLGACGDDTPSSPIEQTPASSAVYSYSSSSAIPTSSVVIVSSSAVIASSSSAAPASSATPVAATVPLASTANTAYAIQGYMSWYSFHFVTEENEMVVYPSLAGEFGEVFSAAYQPAGRVVWSIQTGYYKSLCSVNDATVQAMKFRGCTVSEGIGYGMLLAAFNTMYDVEKDPAPYLENFRTVTGSDYEDKIKGY